MASGSQSARLPPRSPPGRDGIEQAVLDSTISNAKTAATTLSFIQNAKRQARRRLEEERLAKWTSGDHDSVPFFQKMGASLVDGQQALVNCQTATQASPSRKPQDRVNMEIIKSNVEALKRTSQLTRSFFESDSKGWDKPNPNVPGTVDMPAFLRHLQAPGPKRAEASNHGHDEETPRAESSTAQEMSDLEQKALWMELEMTIPPPLPGHQDSVSELAEVDSVAGFGETDSRRSSNEPSKDLSHKSTRISSDAIEDSDDSDDAKEDKEEDDGKPKPPILRFRAQCNFSTEFKSEERVQMERAQREARKATEEEKLKIQGGSEKIDDIVLAWVNHYYAFEVETEYQFHGAFPLICLFMMDNIYPKKIRWHQVDWNAGFTHAYHRNHALLEKIWLELNMDKVRDFRLDPITANIENTVKLTCKEKLFFLKTIKTWFDQRIRHSDMYEPIKRRTEIEHAVRLTGRYVRFPTWMQYDQQAIDYSRRATVQNARREKKMTMTADDWDEMPEFKRLALFLGSSDHTRL